MSGSPTQPGTDNQARIVHGTVHAPLPQRARRNPFTPSTLSKETAGRAITEAYTPSTRPGVHARAPPLEGGSRVRPTVNAPPSMRLQAAARRNQVDPATRDHRDPNPDQTTGSRSKLWGKDSLPGPRSWRSKLSHWTVLWPAARNALAQGCESKPGTSGSGEAWSHRCSRSDSHGPPSVIGCGREVVAEHDGGPLGLVLLSARSHLTEPRLHVQDRSAVDSVEVFDVKVQAVDLDQTTA